MPDHQRVYPEAATVINELLRELDASNRGMFPDVYVGGSFALNDGQPGQSDIDLLLVKADSVSDEDALEAIKPAVAAIQERYPEPLLEGIVVSRTDLVSGPLAITGSRVVFKDGRAALRPDGGLRDPLNWHILAQGGVTWRGTSASSAGIWQDTAALQQSAREKLRDYWRPWLSKSDTPLSPFSGWSLKEDFVTWGVLGVARMAHTLETGTVVSKTEAARWAMTRFGDKWHKILREAIDIRTNRDRTESLYGGPLGRISRRNDVRGFVGAVLKDERIESVRPKATVKLA